MLRGTVALLLGDGRGGGEVGVRGTVGQIGGVGRWGDSLDIPRLRTTAESEEKKGAVFMRCAPHRKEGLMRIKRHVKGADGGLLTVKQERKLSRRMRRGSKCRKRADDYVGIPD